MTAFWFLQMYYLCSLLCPTHTRPPCLGEGLLQDRWRTSNPISQLVLHWPHDDHGVHPPFLQKNNEDQRTTNDVIRNLFLYCSAVGFDEDNLMWQKRKRKASLRNSFWPGDILNLLKCSVSALHLLWWEKWHFLWKYRWVSAAWMWFCMNVPWAKSCWVEIVVN